MAVQVASLFGVLRMQDDEFKSSVRTARSEMLGLGDQMQKLGQNTTALGTSLTGLTAPAAAALGLATKQAMDFDEALTNVQAVTGNTADQMEILRGQILELGSSSRAGPQAVAEAFYDIAGGVVDVSSRMAILEASISAAQAGNAELAGTTKALISIMNGYSFSADKATFASDVLTRTVGMGVGTMDEFAAALPEAASLAAQLGVGFDELGASMAFMTTKGFTASQSTTKLVGIMTAFTKPNDAMKKGLQAMGFESGSAAIKQLGLAGATKALQQALGGSIDEMSAALGTTEALSGAMVLNQDAFNAFSEDFIGGIEGATAAAEAIQMDSAAAQFDLLKSEVSGLAIEVGTALLPGLLSLVDTVKPVIEQVIAWVQQNPELVAQIAAIVLGVGALGAILVPVGAAISAIGVLLGSPLLLPIAAVVAAIAGLVSAFGLEGAKVYLNVAMLYIEVAFGHIKEAIDSVILGLQDFTSQHMDFIVAIGAIAVAVGVLTGGMWLLTTAGAAVTGGFGILTGAIGILLSPVVILTAAIAALVWTASQYYPGGLSKLLSDAATSARQLLAIALFYVASAADWARARLTELLQTILKVLDAINRLKNGLGAYGGAGANWNAAASSGASPGQILGALGSAISQEFGGTSHGLGIDTVPRDMPAFLHQGEGVLTAEENRNRMNGGQGTNIYVTVSERQVLSAAEAQRNGNILGGAILDKMLSRGSA